MNTEKLFNRLRETYKENLPILDEITDEEIIEAIEMTDRPGNTVVTETQRKRIQRVLQGQTMTRVATKDGVSLQAVSGSVHRAFMKGARIAAYEKGFKRST